MAEATKISEGSPTENRFLLEDGILREAKGRRASADSEWTQMLQAQIREQTQTC